MVGAVEAIADRDWSKGFSVMAPFVTPGQIRIRGPAVDGDMPTSHMLTARATSSAMT